MKMRYAIVFDVTTDGALGVTHLLAVIKAALAPVPNEQIKIEKLRAVSSYVIPEDE